MVFHMWIIVFSRWIIVEKHYKTRNCKDFDLFHTSKEKNMLQKNKRNTKLDSMANNQRP